MVDYRKILESQPVTASAPCRVDLGGTLDIPTFSLPLRRWSPCTVNIALNLRTTVQLLPYRRGWVRVSSGGFDPAQFRPAEAPYDHPLGLVFAVAAYFNLDGVDIRIESASPVRSALGGSSVALVALIGALLGIEGARQGRRASPGEVAILAHGLESSLARVPCGFQDQLAAAFGGVNAWHWIGKPWEGGGFKRVPLMDSPDFPALEDRLVVAYVGVPHASKDINGRWVARFLAGRDRRRWVDIIGLVHRFSESLSRKDFGEAARIMNLETEIRLAMTPDVLDPIGHRLTQAAASLGCGARFAGAGGGGCLWAIGQKAAIADLRRRWKEILVAREGARVLDVGVDSRGLLCQS
ncbi:MAG: galactokinase [Desulfobacterales bacterium]|jgi:D-glycero-alpha-D-manno-heptose-7-phosphate kinase